ncbi:hypothetical protein [Streptomyces syringium]|uniref:hypothetical protein n=1 Tax=Streptomyces syringium TaxID=76729 RepID=UPI003453DE9B
MTARCRLPRARRLRLDAVTLRSRTGINVPSILHNLLLGTRRVLDGLKAEQRARL